MYIEPEHIQNYPTHCLVIYYEGNNKIQNSGYLLSLMKSDGNKKGELNQRGTHSIY